MDLDLGAVRAFIAVVDDRHFGDAAARLGISQQAVSKRVARLEADLGTPLLNRARGGAEPTDDGTYFLVHARTLVDLADRTVDLVRNRNRALRVDVMRTRVASADLIRRFHETAPDVEIDIVISSDGLLAGLPALTRGSIDAFISRATGDLGEIQALPAYLEPMHVLVGREHPLAAAERVPMADLAGMSAWIPGARRPETEWADFYRELSAEFGVVIDTSGPSFGWDDEVDRIAASRDLFTFVGERVRIPWNPGIVQIPIVDPTVVFPWSLLWHPRNRHPVLPRLIAHLRDGFRPYRPGREWLPPADRPACTR
ncbi:LysR family transcriptional regulator [Actinomadura sp. 7K507]|uniref:LysR family transcriptional regulator n=1 Tax=Actinomadura sp. 7K507 TaxID=2530365 RepID=UPI00105398B0|nr:LysR family transcriptional regulator [Actinomadura sp. 7K507]TDC79584.1 LysR family transcriptional regulator [Actinomadura sp. 7K507]